MPIALIEPGTVVVAVASPDSTASKLLSNLREVAARGAATVVVAPESVAARFAAARFAAAADTVVVVPDTADPLTAPLVAVVPLQLYAYHVACRRGVDVDRPRNLAKTVTVE